MPLGFAPGGISPANVSPYYPSVAGTGSRFYAGNMNQPTDSSLQATLHECSGTCGAMAAGHALPQIQERLASATPGRWTDAVVVSVSTAGWIEVGLLADDSTVVLWNHADLTADITVGEPVVLHSVYDVLVAGGAKHNVLRAA
jgi:hypothetical protein